MTQITHIGYTKPTILWGEWKKCSSGWTCSVCKCERSTKGMICTNCGSVMAQVVCKGKGA